MTRAERIGVIAEAMLTTRARRRGWTGPLDLSRIFLPRAIAAATEEAEAALTAIERRFEFRTALPDDTLVRVAAALDHEDTVYLQEVIEVRADGSDGPDLVDHLGHPARIALLEQAAERMPG